MDPDPWRDPLWAGLAVLILHVLRYLVWWAMTGLVVFGACWCCRYGAYQAWIRTRPRTRPRRDPVAQEAADGIARIEAFLARTATESGEEARPGDDPDRVHGSRRRRGWRRRSPRKL